MPSCYFDKQQEETILSVSYSNVSEKILTYFCPHKSDKFNWPRSTMDSIRASEAPDAGSIPAEATTLNKKGDYTVVLL